LFSKDKRNISITKEIKKKEKGGGGLKTLGKKRRVYEDRSRDAVGKNSCVFLLAERQRNLDGWMDMAQCVKLQAGRGIRR